MDPYIGEVIERSQQDIFDQARQQSKQFEDAAMGQGAYGGARGALLQGVLAAEAARDAGDLGARLRSQGYNDALNRLGQAATGIASLGQVQQGADQSGIGFQFDLGAENRHKNKLSLILCVKPKHNKCLNLTNELGSYLTSIKVRQVAR